MNKKSRQQIELLEKRFYEKKAHWDNLVKEERKQKVNEGAYMSRKLIQHAYTLAVGNYLFLNNIEEYVAKVNTIIQVLFKLRDRHAAGETIHLILNWPMHHEYIFYALCINDLESAKEMATLCDYNVVSPPAEHDPLNVAFTRSLASLVLNAKEYEIDALDMFEEQCQIGRNRAYIGYAMALRAIAIGSEKGLYHALSNIVENYHRQTGRNDYFHSPEKSLLCFYGVGLVHLSRFKGIAVDFENDIMPRDLIALPKHTYQPALRKKSLLDYFRI